MKRFVLFYCVSMLFNSISAQKITFQSSLNQAFEKAKLENKLVFVEYYSSTCGHCQQLEPFLKDSAVSAFYNAHFISYKLNTDNIKEEDQKFLDKSGIKPDATPLFLFFDQNQQFCHFANTKREVAYLIEIGEMALSPKDRASNLENKYKAGDRTIKTLYAYSNLAQLFRKDSLVDVLADDLFEAFPTQSLGTKKSYLILKNCVHDIENGFFKYWINHIEDIKAFVTDSKGQPDKKEGSEKADLSEIVQHAIFSPKSKKWDLIKINEVKGIVLKLGMSDNPDIYFWQQEMPLLLQQKRHTEALEVAERILKYKKTEIMTQNYFLNQFLIMFEAETDLQMLKLWIDDAASKAESPSDKAEFMFLTILYVKKMGDKPQVVELCQTALAFAQKNGLETARFDKIMADSK